MGYPNISLRVYANMRQGNVLLASWRQGLSHSKCRFLVSPQRDLSGPSQHGTEESREMRLYSYQSSISPSTSVLVNLSFLHRLISSPVYYDYPDYHYKTENFKYDPRSVPTLMSTIYYYGVSDSACPDENAYQHKASTCPSPRSISRGDFSWAPQRRASDPINSFQDPPKFRTSKRTTSPKPSRARGLSAQSNNMSVNSFANASSSINIKDVGIIPAREPSLNNSGEHLKAPSKPRTTFPLETGDLGTSGNHSHEVFPTESLFQIRQGSAAESSNMSVTYSDKLSLPGTPPGPGPGPSFGAFGQYLPPEDCFSTVSYHSDLLLNEECARHQKFQLGVWSLRSRIQNLRVNLREKQRVMSTANDKYFKYISGMEHGTLAEAEKKSKAMAVLQELLHDCQIARDEYGPLEDDCNMLEDQLGNEEFHLQSLEKHLHSRRIVDREARPFSSTSSRSAISDIDQRFHPLVSDYLSSVGAFNILRERLEDQAEEKFYLEQEIVRKARVDLRSSEDSQKLLEDSKKWLDEFPSNQALLRNEVETAQRECDEMKQRCLSMGLVDNNGDPTGLEVQECETLEDNMKSGREISVFVKFPRLMSHQRATQNRSLKSASEFKEPRHEGDNINQWLLDQLQSSPLYVNLLARIYEARFGHIESEAWELAVLAFWDEDGTTKLSSDYQAYSSAITTQAPQKSQYSAKTLSDANSRGSWGISIKYPSLRATHTEDGPEKTKITQGSLLPIIYDANYCKSV